VSLGRQIVTDLYSSQAANEAYEKFVTVSVNKEVPDDIRELKLIGSVGIITLMNENGLVSSRSEARRLIRGGAVSIDGTKILTDDYIIDWQKLPHVLKFGKREFVKLVKAWKT
jgi:tyrosyl-tRNA synthetase